MRKENPTWIIRPIKKYDKVKRDFYELPYSEGFCLARLMGDGHTYIDVCQFSADGKYKTYVCSREWTLTWKLGDEGTREARRVVKNFLKNK